MKLALRSIPVVCTVLLTTLVFSLGCGKQTTSDKIKAEFTSPEGLGGRYVHLLVIGLADDSLTRVGFEDAFSEEIQSQRSVRALRSYKVFPSYADLSDSKAIRRVLSERSADGALTIHVRQAGEFDKESWKTENLEDFLTTGRRPSTAHAAEDAIDLDTGELTLVVGLWDTATYKRVWTGMTDSFSVDDVLEQTDEFADYMVDALRKRGYLSRK